MSDATHVDQLQAFPTLAGKNVLIIGGEVSSHLTRALRGAGATVASPETYVPYGHLSEDTVDKLIEEIKGRTSAPDAVIVFNPGAKALEAFSADSENSPLEKLLNALSDHALPVAVLADGISRARQMELRGQNIYVEGLRTQPDAVIAMLDSLTAGRQRDGLAAVRHA